MSVFFFFFSSRRRHTRFDCDWSSDVCSSDLEEALVRLRGLADHFEKEDPGMHKTNTVDYAVIYGGEMWLELDDGETLHLNRGDVVVQNGTRHVWRNKGNKDRKSVV